MSLLTTLQVQQVAFRWNDVTRVYEATHLTIADEDIGEEFEYSNDRIGWQHDGVRLFFGVESDHFRRISPAASAGNDYIDILDAMDDPTVPVLFYPIYDLDNTVNYEVKRIRGRVGYLETKRTLFKPSASLQMKTVDKITTRPAWARTTRLKG